MPIEVSRSLSLQKEQLLEYFRDRGAESLQTVAQQFAETEFRRRASSLNKAITETREQLLANVEQVAHRQNWSAREILEVNLMVTYVSYISMLELRNAVWPYEYMAFSRRIGELWEPFCKICFEHPETQLSLFVPPLFSEVRRAMTRDIDDYIDELPLAPEQIFELKRYYQKVWSLATSGEIKLELDLHFSLGENRYNIDFKSGFGSNEKGNTNRILLVATIYKNLEQNYHCVLLVRSMEDQNNNYFRVLKNSGIWEAYCGLETYEKIREFTGFDLRMWIDRNVDWQSDFSSEMLSHLSRNVLDQYLV